MMGLEEHLIGMFRHDFEFVDGHRSHLGDGAPAVPAPAVPAPAGVQPADAGPGGAAVQVGTLQSGPAATATLVGERPAEPLLAGQLAEPVAAAAAEPIQAVATAVAGAPIWTPDGEAELHKIPFFVRGRVRRNTEAFAAERGLARIDAETLYDAKAHFSR
jgi:light-independent protochlorophyllide reductase subunit B